MTSSRKPAGCMLEGPPDGTTIVDFARRLAGALAGSRPVPFPAERSWRLLWASDSVEAWVIHWPPGGTIAFHDHGDSFGAVAIANGHLCETRLHGTDGNLTTSTRRVSGGDILEVAPGCIHDIVNGSAEPAISVHAYSPRLRSMTYYEMTMGTLEPLKVVRYDLGADPAATSSLHRDDVRAVVSVLGPLVGERSRAPSSGRQQRDLRGW